MLLLNLLLPADKSGAQVLPAGGASTTKGSIDTSHTSTQSRKPKSNFAEIEARRAAERRIGKRKEREASNLVAVALANPSSKKIKFSYDDDDLEIIHMSASPPPKFKHIMVSTDFEAAGSSTLWLE